MRQLLKMNYAAHLLTPIDLGKAIKRWATMSNIKKQKKRPAAWAVGRLVFLRQYLRSRVGQHMPPFLYISLA